jgi:hypothetical protein
MTPFLDLLTNGSTIRLSISLAITTDDSVDETSAALTLVSPEPMSKAHRFRIRASAAACEVVAPAITKPQRKRRKTEDLDVLAFIWVSSAGPAISSEKAFGPNDICTFQPDLPKFSTNSIGPTVCLEQLDGGFTVRDPNAYLLGVSMNLSDDCVAPLSTLVRRRLVQAGVRLRRLLDNVFK